MCLLILPPLAGTLAFSLLLAGIFSAEASEEGAYGGGGGRFWDISHDVHFNRVVVSNNEFQASFLLQPMEIWLYGRLPLVLSLYWLDFHYIFYDTKKKSSHPDHTFKIKQHPFHG